MREKFPHLERVMIVRGQRVSSPDDYGDVIKRLAVVGAQYFEQMLPPPLKPRPLHIGLSGGETIWELVRAIPDLPRPDVHIHTTGLVGLGNSAMSPSHVDPTTNALSLWETCGHLDGCCRVATVAPYVFDQAKSDHRKTIAREIKRMADNKNIRETIEAMDDIEIAFTGIGTLTPPPKSDETFRKRLTMVSLLGDAVGLKELVDERAAADLSYCLIDKDGNGDLNKWGFFLTAGHYSQYKGIDFYKRMVSTGRKVVAIAGPYKVAAIRAALNAKAFNVWITDEDSARQIADGE